MLFINYYLLTINYQLVKGVKTMTTFIRRMLYILFAIVTISGGIMFFSGASDCYGELVSGDVYYVIDSIATSYSTELFNKTKTIYYLVPIKSGKYILVASGNTTEINTFDRIFQQTCQYLNKEIEDTLTSINIDGKIFPVDENLKELLYSWAESTNYFSTTDKSAIDEEVLPYVVCTQNWSNIKSITISGLITLIVGIVGIIVVKIVSKRLISKELNS